MDKRDFLKFLYENDLNYVYGIGRYMLNRYSLPEATSFLSQKIDGIYNLYDLIKRNKNPKKLRINCDQTRPEDGYETRELTYTIPSGTILIKGRGIISNFIERPLSMTNGEEFIVMRFNIGMQNPDIANIDVFFSLTYGKNNIPHDAVLTSKGTAVPIDDMYVKEVFFCNKFFIGNEGNTYKISDMNSLIWNKLDVNLYTEREQQILPNRAIYSSLADYILFINTKKNMAIMAAYNTLSDELSVGNKFYLSIEGRPQPINLFLNISWKIDSSQYTTENDIKYRIIFKNKFNEEKIIKWLKTISLYNMNW